MTAFQLACEDTGHPDCAFLVRSDNRNEVIDRVRQHSRDAHRESYTREEVLTALSRVDWEPR